MRGNARIIMTDRPRLLSGLLARRTDLAEEVSKAEAQLRQHYETLRSLDHLIRLEDPEVELPPIRNAKLADRPKTASTLVRGDVSRLCLDALREAAGAILTSRQVADYIVRRRQLVFATKREDNDFASSVTMALARHAKRQLVEKVGNGSNREGHWRVSPSKP